MFERLRKLVCAHRDAVVETWRLFEQKTLVFPVAVTVLAAVTLLLGGRVMAWQWWVPVGGVLGWTLLCRTASASLRRRLGAYGLFLLLLAGIWLAAGILMPQANCDNVVYHFPATRLLIEGWNPVYAPTPETLAATTGVEPWEMRLWHVLFMSKAVWMFNATAYSFTKTPFDLLFPLFPLLFIATTGQLWRLLRGMSWGVRVLGILLLWAWVPACSGIVDTAVCLGGVGLLAAMTRRLAGERDTFLPMVCMSFWMMVAKQPGLLSCFIFWVCFTLVLLWRERISALPRLAGAGTLLIVLFLTVCTSPYLTSWIHYGHPLYPAYSVDEAKHPVYDITADFRICNADAEAMGHLGSFANAYLCPSLTQAYYRWKLGQTTFAPNRDAWRLMHDGRKGATEPLPAGERIILLAAFAAMVLFGGKRFRFIGIATIVGLFCFPTAYLGYLRYVPWEILIRILGVCSVSAWLLNHLPRTGKRMAAMIFTIMGLGWLIKPILLLAVTLDQAQACHAFLTVEPPKILHGYLYAEQITADCVEDRHPISSEIFGQPSQIMLANLRLLCRQVPVLRDTKVLPLDVEAAATYSVFFNYEFYLKPKVDLTTYSTHLRLIANPNRKERLMGYPRFVARTFTITLPKLLWARMRVLWQ